jgi:type III restriction enzyme
VSAFSCPILPREDAAAKTFRYEGYDIITLQKLVEREYNIPEPQTAEDVIGYYARRIAQDVKLLSQFSSLAPKVKEFLETKAFGGPVALDEPAMIKAISSNVAQYVTVKTLSKLSENLLFRSWSRSSCTPVGHYPKHRHPARRSTQTSVSSILFLVIMNSRKSLPFFCKAPDVQRFAKLPEQFGFAIHRQRRQLALLRTRLRRADRRRRSLYSRDEGSRGH